MSFGYVIGEVSYDVVGDMVIEVYVYWVCCKIEYFEVEIVMVCGFGYLL